MSRSQRLYLQDILERILHIEFCTAGGRETFLNDRLLQDGVILAYMIIGEAVKRLDTELIEAAPEVMWSDYAGFRDVLIHRYHDVLLEQVWLFSQEDLPPLKAAITAMLASVWTIANQRLKVQTPTPRVILLLTMQEWSRFDMAIQTERTMTVAEYLAWEARQEIKHEYIDGVIIEMTGGTH